MTISPTDRKLLWGKAANRCAICRRVLVADEKPADPQAVIGEEAHIVSRSDDGPRGRQIPRHLLDKYDNLILLSPSCHTEVDKQFTTWTRRKLLDTKREHERWADRQLSSEQISSDQAVHAYASSQRASRN